MFTTSLVLTAKEMLVHGLSVRNTNTVTCTSSQYSPSARWEGERKQYFFPTSFLRDSYTHIKTLKKQNNINAEILCEKCHLPPPPPQKNKKQKTNTMQTHYHFWHKTYFTSCLWPQPDQTDLIYSTPRQTGTQKWNFTHYWFHPALLRHILLVSRDYSHDHD